MGFERVRAFVLCVSFACVLECESGSFMPVERQWAVDYCQSGTELHAHSVSVSGCECASTGSVFVCVFMGER